MKAERDGGFGPVRPTRAADIGGVVRPSAEAPAADAPRYRRGEREAHTLLRRRRVHTIRRLLPPVVLTLAVVAALLSWRSGAAGAAGEVLVAALNRQAVSAGLVVKNIVITGREHLSEADLHESLAVGEGTAIFAVDLEAMRERIAGIGWVKTVSVARRLPDTLFIAIEERTPVALWQHNKVMMLIDGEGRPITTAGLAPYGHLPLVVGAGAATAAGDLIPTLASEPELQRRVRAAVRVGERRWDVIFTNGVRVRLPEDGAAEAWAKLAELQRADHVLEREVHIVDLRQADRLVVRLTEKEIKRRQDLAREASGKGGRI